jgi:outer membrane protein OmpA-like peptidoglycan-associated protein
MMCWRSIIRRSLPLFVLVFYLTGCRASAPPLLWEAQDLFRPEVEHSDVSAQYSADWARGRNLRAGARLSRPYDTDESMFITALVASSQLELARSGYGRNSGVEQEVAAQASSIRAQHPAVFERADREILRLEEFGETTQARAAAERAQTMTTVLELLRRAQSLKNPIDFTPNSTELTASGRETLGENVSYMRLALRRGGTVAVVGFADSAELRPAELARARADVVFTQIQSRVPTDALRGAGAGTDRGFGGTNHRAMVMFFAPDSTTRSVQGPRVRGPVGSARNSLERWASRAGWATSQSVEPFEVKFPQVREHSTEGGRQRFASYRVFFLPDSEGCFDTHVFYNFFSQSRRERGTYVTAADRAFSPDQASTLRTLLQTLQTLETCNGEQTN